MDLAVEAPMQADYLRTRWGLDIDLWCGQWQGSCAQARDMIMIQRQQRGGETQGRGKHTINPLPPKTVLDPPTYDTISPPPPLCSRNVILLRGNGHRPDKSHFLRPPKLVLDGVLYGTFSPPKIARCILPPPPLCEFPNDWQFSAAAYRGINRELEATNPAPNKNGSYGINGGVRMPYVWVRMPSFL